LEEGLLQGDTDATKMSTDLAEMVSIWPSLPDHIKAAIKALIETCTKEAE